MQLQKKTKGVMEAGNHLKNSTSLKNLTGNSSLLKKVFYFSALIVAVTVLSSCRTRLPNTFVKATDGGTWTQIVLRENLEYNKVFDEVLDHVARRYEMDFISKESGYVRSQWSYTWNSGGNNTYRTRVVFKFTLDRKTIELKTDAEYGKGDNWIRGFDNEILRTLKQDIMAIVGRTTL